MIEKKKVIDKIEILEDGQIQVREATKIIEDGIEIAKTYHRHVLEPGANLIQEDTRVSKVAQTIWTKAVIDEFLKNRKS